MFPVLYWTYQQGLPNWENQRAQYCIYTLGDVKLSVAEGEAQDLLNHVISVKPANLFFLFLSFRHNIKCPELSLQWFQAAIHIVSLFPLGIFGVFLKVNFKIACGSIWKEYSSFHSILPYECLLQAELPEAQNFLETCYGAVE